MNEHIKTAVEYAFANDVSNMQDSIQSAIQSKVLDALGAKRIEVAQSFAKNTNESVNEEQLDEYEIVKRYNPRTGKHEYVDDEGNVMHGSGGASWQKSWYSRKRPSDYSSSSTSQKIYHNVPFKQKDQAKAEGMRFDGEKKKWYHTNAEKSKNSAFDKLEESYLEEKLSVSDGVQAWIKDFIESDNPKFEGKSKKERMQMALGAFYAAKKGTNEEVEELDEISSKLAFKTARKRGERMSKAWRANDMDTFDKERDKAEKTYNIATKKALENERKNPQKREQSYPLGGYSRASNRSYSEEVEV